VEIENFTDSGKYFGEHIFKILINAIDDLLKRMQREIDETLNPNLKNFLEVQINSSYYATWSMDHLVTNEKQWNQLNYVRIYEYYNHHFLNRPALKTKFIFSSSEYIIIARRR